MSATATLRAATSAGGPETALAGLPGGRSLKMAHETVDPHLVTLTALATAATVPRAR
jgi:hypothetical protein